MNFINPKNTRKQPFLRHFVALFALCTLYYVLCTGAVSAALTFPEPRGYVNDYANILNDTTVSTLESRLSQFASSTTNQVVVVTVTNLQDTTVEDYAVRLFEKWGIGTKEKDNGILLLVAQQEREVRIEVGYGLEPSLNDAKAGRIIRDVIIPVFRTGDYDGGVTRGVEAILGVLSGDESVLPVASTRTQGENPFFPLMVVFFFASGILQYLLAFLARSKTAMPGGILGVVLGVIVGLIFAFPILGVLGISVVLGILGFLLDLILSKNYQNRKSQGLPTDWFHSGGGFFGSGRSSGGLGGFGGFGGGRSGGGGASGRW